MPVALFAINFHHYCGEGKAQAWRVLATWRESNCSCHEVVVSRQVAKTRQVRDDFLSAAHVQHDPDFRRLRFAAGRFHMLDPGFID